MIARIFVFLVLLTILPDLYIDLHYLRKKKGYGGWRRLLWWLPALLMLVYTIRLTTERNFIPDNPAWVDGYLLLLGLFIIPKNIFMVCSLLGLASCRLRRKQRNWGNALGLVLGLLFVYVVIYGSTIGFRELKVKRMDIAFSDLPAAFDGYRIVLWSDAHVGTYRGARREILERAIDSIRAQQADMVVFTGDLQNLQPTELEPFDDLLGSIRARDGVYSVLGNHDYSGYIQAPAAVKLANERELVAKERGYGWTLLLNESRSIHRGNDSIVIAGGENDGRPPYPAKGDIRKTLRGIGNTAFVVMLQHDPSAWRRHILPQSGAQLTLSGHTHGGQLSLFGLPLSRLVYTEDLGLYTVGNRAIYVSAGLGGVVPFRFEVPGEIAVITLHRKK